MAAFVSPVNRGDARLVAVALGLSLLGNAGLVALLTVAEERMPQKREPVAPPPAERIVVFRPEDPPVAAESEAMPESAATPVERPFTQTSAEQPEGRENRARFIGDRDTLASSTAAPDADAPPLPSQTGRAPRRPGELELRESRFQEGQDLPPVAASAPPPPPVTPQAARADAMPRGTDSNLEGASATEASPAAEPSVALPNPVDVAVPVRPEREMPVAERVEKPREGVADGSDASAEVPQKPRELSRPRPPIQDPAFRSEARKNEIRGSISRTGPGSLDVENTPLGRYRATVMKAIEQEWQRAAVRHRDYIQPGFLTVRFFIEPDGKVRSVQFVSEMDTGQIQKGFTHSSIRDAPIPAMPPPVREALGGEPLELLINFYF